MKKQVWTTTLSNAIYVFLSIFIYTYDSTKYLHQATFSATLVLFWYRIIFSNDHNRLFAKDTTESCLTYSLVKKLVSDKQIFAKSKVQVLNNEKHNLFSTYSLDKGKSVFFGNIETLDLRNVSINFLLLVQY